MNTFLRAVRLTLGLAGLLVILILLPAFLFGAIARWQVTFLAISYFGFFLGTVWRTLKYGDLTKRSEDEQVKSTWGRLALVVVAIGLLGVHWLALYDFSHSYEDDLLWAIASMLLIISSIIISQTAIRSLGKFFDRLTTQPDHQLVKTGIYSGVRHPIYLSYILLFTGFCTMLQSIVSVGLLAGVCIVWFGNRIAIEEEMLEKKFGDEYKAYQQQTKKLLPFIY